MTPRPNAARIGLFAIGGLVLLVAAVALVFGGRLFAQTERAVMHFRGSIFGLQAGSPVVFRGVRLGSVKTVGVVHDGRHFQVPVVVELDRDRIRNLHGDSAAGDPAVALNALVEHGLTAQLATQSLLTGQLYIDLDLRPGTGVAVKTFDGMVEIPTTLTRFQSLQDQLDRVDLARMAEDLTATLSAARGLIAGPELKKTLSELASASASLARLAATLDQRAAPLADAAQATLGRAGEASVRVVAAAERVASAAARADALLAPGSPLLASVQKAADELGRSAAALREATADDSASVQTLQRAMSDVSRAARAVRELADLLVQQPQALVRGRQAAP
jgi:paraquat-inducible protein B